MNRRIDKLIPKAIEVANQHLASNGVIKSEYNGYISAFGAAVLQSGLKAAIAFNESASSGSAQDKKPLMKAILYLIKKNVAANDKLLEHVLANGNDTPETKDEIMAAAAALKLAIRTFELKRENEL